MGLPPRSNNNTGTISTLGVSSGFVPPVAPKTGTVKVMLLQSMRSDATTPLQKSQGRDGAMVEQPRVLMDLVGIYLDTEISYLNEEGVETKRVEPRLYPDPTGRNPMPSLGSAEWNALMMRPSGIFVEALYPEAAEEIREALEQEVVGFPFTLEEYTNAIQSGTLNQLLRTFGGFLRASGYIRKQEWLVKDVIGGSKTIQVSFFHDGEADVYVESFLSMRAHHGFANVAFACEIGNTMTVTDLANGPSFTPNGVYFQYTQTRGAGPMGRVKYTIDPDFTKSGALYGAPVTGARNASELASNANRSNTQGAVNSTERRRREREESMKRQMGVPAIDLSLV